MIVLKVAVISNKWNKKLVVFKITNNGNKWNKMEFVEKLRIPENEKIRKRGFLK